MSSTLELTRRIKSAKNIRQITKAMEMVSASKMRRAQSQALSSRPYSRKLQSTLQTIAQLTNASSHPLLESHDDGQDVLIVVSTDRSLAGSLNSNLFRAAHAHLKEHGAKPEIIIVGQKAKPFAASEDLNLYADFSNLPDKLTFADTLPLSELVINRFLDHSFRTVNIMYMDFVSTLVQKFRPVQLLPIPQTLSDFDLAPAETLESLTTPQANYLFEPSAAEMLNWLLPYYVKQSVYQIILEARASEHSARMVAMKNANENAGEIIYDLTLSFNKQRQASITAEILDNARAANAKN